MKRSSRTLSILSVFALSFCLVHCADDQGQEEGVQADEQYDEQGYDQEGYDEEQGEQGQNQAGQNENYGNEGQNYNDEGGQNYGQEQQQGYAQGEQLNQGAGLGEGDQQDILSNNYQNTEGAGEGINNAVGDEYAADQQPMPDADMAAVDAEPTQQQMPLPQGQQQIPTYMPEEVPPGWAITQNGLFINLSDLTDEPIGYDEPPATWQ